MHTAPLQYQPLPPSPATYQMEESVVAALKAADSLILRIIVKNLYNKSPQLRAVIRYVFLVNDQNPTLDWLGKIAPVKAGSKRKRAGQHRQICLEERYQLVLYLLHPMVLFSLLSTKCTPKFHPKFSPKSTSPFQNAVSRFRNRSSWIKRWSIRVPHFTLRFPIPTALDDVVSTDQ